MNVTGKTQVLALFGDPVAHSLSPQMQNAWIADHGIDAVYVALPVTGEDAAAFFFGLRSARLKGANITVPHKELAATAAHVTEERVANVLRWEPDGRISAFNTDGKGFLRALDDAAPGWRARVRNVLIIGAGGAAAGLAPTLEQNTAVKQIRIVNRTVGRAEAIVAMLSWGGVGLWQDLPTLFAEADLIINATTLGMSGAPSPPWPVSRCKPSAIVVDIVYRPLETPLLAAARARGLIAVDGLGMLIHQGALSFELWFGIRPDTAKARARLTQILEAET